MLALLVLQSIVQPAVFVRASNNDAVSANVTVIDSSTEDLQVLTRSSRMEAVTNIGAVVFKQFTAREELDCNSRCCAAVAF